jgi:hypothetical protein
VIFRTVLRRRLPALGQLLGDAEEYGNWGVPRGVLRSEWFGVMIDFS